MGGHVQTWLQKVALTTSFTATSVTRVQVLGLDSLGDRKVGINLPTELAYGEGRNDPG